MKLPLVLGLTATLLLGGVAAAGVLAGYTHSFLADTAADGGSAYGGEVLKVWKGDFTQATGAIDFRMTGGNVWISTWDQPTYEVTLVKQKSDNGQRLGDAQLTYDFTATGGKLVLKVAQSGDVAVSVNGRATDDVAVVAKVPAAASWDSVLVCTGSSSSQFDAALQPIIGLFGGSQGAIKPCLDGGSPPIDMSVNSQDTNSSLTVPFLLEDLKGGSLEVRNQYGSVALAHDAFANASVALQYGSLSVNGSRGASFHAVTQYGSIRLAQVQAPELLAQSQYGSILLDTPALGDGKAHVSTQYGGIGVHVPTGDHGYDVQADTQYGDVRIVLEGADVTDTSPSPGFATHATSPLALHSLPATSSPSGDSQSAHSAHAKTRGFEAKANHLTMDLETQYGDIHVWDGPFDAERSR